MKLIGRPLPTVLGFVACYWAGWGLYHLMLIGSCSTPPSDGLRACPPGSEQYFFAVFGGMFAAVPLMIAGGGALVFLALFASVGWAGVAASRAEAGEPWLLWFGAIFLAVPVLGLVGFVASMRKQRLAERLVAEGAEAIGTVLSIRDTGILVNGNPRVKLRFRIEPVDGMAAPFEAEKTATVSRVAIPRVGESYPVWFDRADPSRWGFATAIDETAPAGARRLWELARRTAAPARPEPLATPVPPGAGDALLNELAALNDLRARGAIGDRDFASRTAQIVRQLQARTPA